MSAPCTRESHDLIKSDPAAFSSLPFVGEMEDEDEDGNPAVLCLRNCRLCHSTLCVQFPVAPWLTTLREAGCL